MRPTRARRVGGWGVNFFSGDITLLLGPLSNVKLATQRIQEMEKAFPNERHPFQYYSKSTDEKIKDIFSRISFSFVESLVLYINSELPQINLIERPLVESRRTSGAVPGRCNFQGRRASEPGSLARHLYGVLAVRRPMDYLRYQSHRGEEAFAKQEREKHKGDAMSADAMLSYLETAFKSHFPKIGVHENIDAAKQRPKEIVE